MKNKNTTTLDKIFLTKLTGEWGKECQVGKKGIKVLRTTNFTNTGIINYSTVIEREIPNNKITEKKLIYGDIILEKSGGSDNQPVGRVVYYDKKDEQYLCNNFTQILRTKNDIAYSRYIFYFMFNLHKSGATKLLQNKTTGIRNLQVKKYMNIEIQLPPINIQKKISNTLDKLTNLINLRKQQLEKLDLLIKSKFIDMFGDPIENPKRFKILPVIKLTSVLTGSTPSRKNDKYYNGRIPWIKTGEIIKGYIYDAEEYISDLALKKTNCKILPINSILVAMYGQGVTRGQTGLLKIKAATNQACAAILPNKSFNTEYLYRYLIIQYTILRNLGRGGNQSNLNLSMIKKFPVLYPPIELQNQFSAVVEETEKQKLLITQSLEKLELLYKSLMQKYFE